jgi:hypothetical protein
MHSFEAARHVVSAEQGINAGVEHHARITRQPRVTGRVASDKRRFTVLTSSGLSQQFDGHLQ